MSIKMKKSFAKEMQNMEAAGLLRNEATILERTSMEALIRNDKGIETSALNFFSTDFLAWHTHESIRETAHSALINYGTGSTSSRATLGTRDILLQLEDRLCDFLGLEACIVLSSKYLANIGIFDPLTIERDCIFVDERSDSGLIDGARLSKAKAVAYKFKDYENLEYHLKCSEHARYRIIVSDGIFNSDGSWADLELIHQLKQRYDAISVVDDSLGLGLMGGGCTSTFDYLKCDKPDILSGSFAFALGNVAGGFIGGDKTLVEWLRQSSRSYILSEPLSPVNAAVVLKALDILESDLALMESLFFNVKYLKEQLNKNNWEVIDNKHPLVSIVIGGTLIAQKMIELLFEKGVLVSGLCYPNTEEGAAQIRIHLSAKHSKQQIDRLVSTLEEIKYLAEDVEQKT